MRGPFAPLLACALSLGACARARPAPAAPSAPSDARGTERPAADAGLRADAGAGAAADAGLHADAGAAMGPAEIAGARAEALWLRREEPDALEEAARLWEEAAAHADSPLQPLVSAATARRARAEELAARAAAAPPDAAPGSSGAELLAASARESASCAADARRAWSSAFPAAAAALDERGPDAFALVGTAGAQPLYLDALCTAAWSRAQGFTQLIERHAELQAELSRAAALSPSLDDAGPDRELGKLFAALPAYAGGNLREAREHFEAALARSASISTRLLFARSVAVKQQDRALFESQLRSALDASAATPEDRAAQGEARALLGRESDLFGAAP